jgi:hypothetical protein
MKLLIAFLIIATALAIYSYGGAMLASMGIG